MPSARKRRDFLIELADLVLDSRYNSFVDWNPERKILTIKSKDMFAFKIVPQKFCLEGIDAFSAEMKEQGFVRALNRSRKKSQAITFRCTSFARFSKCFRLVDLTLQAENATKLTVNKLSTIMEDLKQKIPFEQTLEQIFQLKQMNRHLKEITLNVTLQLQTDLKDQPEDYRMMELSQKDIDLSPRKTKTMQVIPVDYDI